MITHSFNPRIWETESSGSLVSSRPAWATNQHPEQPELHIDPVSKDKNINKHKLKRWLSS